MLKQRIQSDTIQAFKKGDKETVGVLRLTLAAVLSKEKEKRYKIAVQKPIKKEEDLEKDSLLTDEQVLDVLSSEIKKRKDAAVLYQEGNRPELVEKEQKEIKILQSYLPEQISADELKKLIEKSIAKTGTTSIKDMRRVMADLVPQTKGRAETREISRIVKELLDIP